MQHLGSEQLTTLRERLSQERAALLQLRQQEASDTVADAEQKKERANAGFAAIQALLGD